MKKKYRTQIKRSLIVNDSINVKKEDYTSNVKTKIRTCNTMIISLKNKESLLLTKLTHLQCKESYTHKMDLQIQARTK